MIGRVRYYIFLRDVLMLAVTTFGGPQAHLAHFQNVLVDKRKYLTEDDLMEINSLCQILPGPTSRFQNWRTEPGIPHAARMDTSGRYTNDACRNAHVEYRTKKLVT